MLNLTQHAATPDQLRAGVVEPLASDGTKKLIQTLLTFNDLPTTEQIKDAAERLAEIAARRGAKSAMIGGAPWLSRPLEDALLARGIKPAYAFSARVSQEEHLPDGSVRKVQVFVHQGFVWP